MKRFIYHFKEQSSYSTIQFVKMAISFFGYKPKIIQIDNSFEFIHFKDTRQIHPFDVLYNQLDINTNSLDLEPHEIMVKLKEVIEIIINSFINTYLSIPTIILLTNI